MPDPTNPWEVIGHALKSLGDVDKLTPIKIIAILFPVIVGPGVSLVNTYLNNRSKLTGRRQQLEHYQAVMQLVEQASKLSGDAEKLDKMLGGDRSSALIQKIIHDAYDTLEKPQLTPYIGGYKFLLLRQAPIVAKYYATPVPKTFAEACLTVIYYIYTFMITTLYMVILYLVIVDQDKAIDYPAFFKVFMCLLLTIVTAPLFYVLSRFWRLLFNLRRHHEDILAGVTPNGPAKTIERPDFRVGTATMSAVVARMGRPTSDQASPDGGRTLTYSTAPKLSWLWPVPVLGFLAGTVVAWFAGGAVRDTATEGFEFGATGVLTQTWMSRSRPGEAKDVAHPPPPP